MTYVIAQPCVDLMDRACVDEGPVEAIYYEDDLPGPWAPYLAANAMFFSQTLTGRPAPLGSPGGAATTGPVGADTALVEALPPQHHGDRPLSHAEPC